MPGIGPLSEWANGLCRRPFLAGTGMSDRHHSYDWCLSACQCSCPDWLRPLESRKLTFVSPHSTDPSKQLYACRGSSGSGYANSDRIEFVTQNKAINKQCSVGHITLCECASNHMSKHKLTKRRIVTTRRFSNSRDAASVLHVRCASDVSHECAFPVYGCFCGDESQALLPQVSLSPDHYTRMANSKYEVHAELLAYVWNPSRIAGKN